MSYIKDLGVIERRHPVRTVASDELRSVALQMGLITFGQKIDDKELLKLVNKQIGQENKKVAKLRGEVEHIIGAVGEELDRAYAEIAELKAENKKLQEELREAQKLQKPKRTGKGRTRRNELEGE